MIIQVLIFLALWGALHFYVFARLLTIPWFAAHFPLPVLVPLVAFLALSYVASRIIERYGLGRFSHQLEYIGANWVGVFFLLFTGVLASDVVTGFGLLFRPEQLAIRLIALAATAVLVLIAFVQAQRVPVITEYEVAMPGLPRVADGTVLAVASDLHLGSMLGKRWARARAAQIAALQPDLLLLVGDIFEGEEETHDRWAPVLGAFTAKHGAFVVSGNHEFYAGPDAIFNVFRRAGFRVLRDEHVEALPGLVVAGVDDPAFRGNGRRDQAIAVEQALSARPAGATILLSHTPVLAERAAELGGNLMFSGHTHEGQIWPFNYLVRLAFRLVRGRYNVNGMTAIVGRGTGTWGPRMRLWKRSELLKVTLRSGDGGSNSAPES